MPAWWFTTAWDGIFLRGRAFHAFTEQPGNLQRSHSHTRMLAFLQGSTDEYKLHKGKTVHIWMHLHIRALVLSSSPSSPFALLQRFPVRTVYLSWYIQIMNTRSQQVWTQLLNIQPSIPSRSLSQYLSVFHLKTLLSFVPTSLPPTLLYF